MESNWLSSTANVTKVAISLVLIAAFTQVLAAIGAISLSTTAQVTIWLVAGGLSVLLLIADMACHAYLTAQKYRSGERPADHSYATAPGPTTQGPAAAPPEHPDATTPGPTTQGPAAAPPEHPDATTPGPTTQGPPKPLRVISADGLGDDDPALQNGPRLPVNMKDVFPRGCYLVPASIGETYDYDEKNKTCRPAVDKITGQRVYECRVVDMDPERKGHSRETEVKIVADQMPVSPTQAQYGAVEFEGLTAIPYATKRGRAAYDSLRATGIKQAITRPRVA